MALRRWNLVIHLLAGYLQLSSFTIAQSSASRTSTSPSSRQTSTGQKVHIVEVSSGDYAHQFFPNVTRAATGDLVSFRFWPNNHSVVRGEYTDSGNCGSSGCNPCVPWELIHPDQKQKAFFSGSILTSVDWSSSNESTVWNYTVVDEAPVWFFCTAIASCNGGGMVGVINPGNRQSIDKQVITAENAKIEINPGQPWPYAGIAVGAMDTSGQSPTTTGSGPAQTSSTGPSETSSHVHGLAGGAIAGIAVGAAVVVALAAGLCYFVGRSNTYREVIKRNASEGVPSQVGEVQTQNAAWGAQQAPSPQQNWQDHRFSGQTAFSNISPRVDNGPSTFVGYNRQTGAPEFDTEAPTGDEKSGPPLSHPAFGSTPQHTTYELAGGTVPSSLPSYSSPTNPPMSTGSSPVPR